MHYEEEYCYVAFNYYGIKSFRVCKWKRNGQKRECKTGAVDENAKDKEELNEHVNEEEKKDDIDNEEE